jgi:ribosome-binding protein aMBF1 (putative translation factor)
VKEQVMYLRDGGVPFGAVARLEDGRLGWSLCGPRDHFRKDLARRIALGRAAKSAHAQQTAMEVIDHIQSIHRYDRRGARPATDRLERILAALNIVSVVPVRNEKGEER